MDANTAAFLACIRDESHKRYSLPTKRKIPPIALRDKWKKVLGDAREKKGWTLHAIGVKAKLSALTITSVFAGGRASKASYMAVAKVLGVELQEGETTL